jgi:hypothetical protein
MDQGERTLEKEHEFINRRERGDAIRKPKAKATLHDAMWALRFQRLVLPINNIDENNRARNRLFLVRKPGLGAVGAAVGQQ